MSDQMREAATLFEHDDGRYRVWCGTGSPPWTAGDPAWHRVGPVQIDGAAAVQPVAWRKAETGEVASDVHVQSWRRHFGKNGIEMAKGYTEPLYAAPPSTQEPVSPREIVHDGQPDALTRIADVLGFPNSTSNRGPVAIIRFERGTPGCENEMPRVMSCNRLPDGEYEAYLAPAAQQEPVAVIGDTYTLHWAGSGPIAPLIQRHGLKVGDKLYAAPAAPVAPQELRAGTAHEIWSAAQLAPGEGISDGVARIERILAAPQERQPLSDEQIGRILLSIDPESKRIPEGRQKFAHAIEVHNGIAPPSPAEGERT